jgi:hypothetical protein
VFRGSAFQSDLFDLLEHPMGRITRRGQDRFGASSRHSIAKRRQHLAGQSDLVGTEYDPVTQEIQIPERLTEHQRSTIERGANMLRADQSSADCYGWTKRILQRYSSSATSVVLVHLPKGPLAHEPENSDHAENNTDALPRDQKVVVFDPGEFAFLERPAYYVDGFHFNRKGREQFTQRLTEDLLARFGTGDATEAPARLDTPPQIER